jgi:hypothetical protein
MIENNFCIAFSALQGVSRVEDEERVEAYGSKDQFSPIKVTLSMRMKPARCTKLRMCDLACLHRKIFSVVAYALVQVASGVIMWHLAKPS